MPRPDSFHIVGAYSSTGKGRGHSSLSSEETAGIVVLAIIAAVVLIFGCWYFKKRNGYKILKSQTFSPATFQSLMRGTRENEECKLPLKDYSTLTNVVACAPPAYEKIAAQSQPPPYTP